MIYDSCPLTVPTGSTPVPQSPLAHSNTGRLSLLSSALNAGAKAKADADSRIKDDSVLDDFKPHFLHQAHAPVPMALVNRKPHGMPGHQDVRVPQDAAWLAGMQFAQKSIFMYLPPSLICDV